ncbi:hypothetical protein IV56_GL002005 [Lacticaseibacillus saniviri JCM 17471 = DSM 24301]|uniref:Uncharacterized protein n=1 Tax=Lacticaseibacillus saniviri JCM 17471 = DSM 24301 TaxID=1293598 RepID=A0A0R2MQY3_9LACO|nr:hypothetical protein IV56_GL002005 [Lacticaseibacillus saniviri JCM 17471 = DSM 24301]
MLGMSPATIIRLLFIAVIGVMYLLALKNKRELWFYAGYLLLLGVYFIFHQRNAMLFHSLVPGNFAYSTFGELFYIVRMLIPLFMIVISAKIEYDDLTLVRLINWLTIFFSGSIVLTNILGISLGSYIHQWGSGSLIEQYQHQRITGTIFNWFARSNTMDFYGMASKGFFNHANTTGTILILLTPLVLYALVKRFDWKNIVLAIVHFMACQELGTKAAGYGTLAMIAVYIVVYLFFTLIKKELKFNAKLLVALLLILAGSYGLNRFAPTANRQASEDVVHEELTADKPETSRLDVRVRKLEKSGTKKQKIKFIYKYRQKFGLNEGFVTKSYPAKYDPDFWLNVMTWPGYSRMNYRYLQMQIWKRVSALNNNSKDKLFGFGYIRLNNMGLIERDFVSQYYAMGIIGTILLVVPYLVLTLIDGIKMLFNFKRLVTLKTVSLMFAILAMLAVSIYTGYVLDYLTATILLAFFMGQLTRIVWRKPSAEER